MKDVPETVPLTCESARLAADGEEPRHTLACALRQRRPRARQRHVCCATACVEGADAAVTSMKRREAAAQRDCCGLLRAGRGQPLQPFRRSSCRCDPAVVANVLLSRARSRQPKKQPTSARPLLGDRQRRRCRDRGCDGSQGCPGMAVRSAPCLTQAAAVAATARARIAAVRSPRLPEWRNALSPRPMGDNSKTPVAAVPEVPWPHLGCCCSASGVLTNIPKGGQWQNAQGDESKTPVACSTVQSKQGAEGEDARLCVVPAVQDCSRLFLGGLGRSPTESAGHFCCARQERVRLGESEDSGGLGVDLNGNRKQELARGPLCPAVGHGDGLLPEDKSLVLALVFDVVEVILDSVSMVATLVIQ